MLDLVQLRSFLEVAERGTVAAAAATLGYTPPAVTQQVAKLERTLGTALFDRAGGRLRLSNTGTVLLPIAREMLDLARRAADAVQQPLPRQRITIGGIASAIAALVAPLRTDLADCADVHVIELEDADALRELRLGHVDVALIQEYPGDDAQRDPRLSYTVAATDALRLILPPSWPASTSLNEVRDMPWLVNGTGTRCESATRGILAAAKAEPTVVGDVSDNRLLIALVAAGHGATIVPELVLADSPLQVTISSHDIGIARSLIAVTRQSPSPAALAVIDRLVSQ